MERLKLVGVQLELSNNIRKNFEKHLRYIEDIDADVIIFPECSLVGYDLNEIKEINFDDLENFHKELVKLINSQKTEKTVVFGSIRKEKGKLYNCAYIVNREGCIIYKKINLTEEEINIFEKGNEIKTIEIKNKKVSPIICRDQSDILIFQKLKENRSDMVIILSAHYYNTNDIFWKKYKNIAIPITRAIDFGFKILKVNSIGSFYNKISHGNSLYVDENGKLLNLLNEYDENIIEVII